MIRQKRREILSEIEDSVDMKNSDWKDRLGAAVEKSGKSMRAISLAAGMGPGYIHALLGEGKEPTLSSLLAICRELDISLSYLVYGQDFSRVDEEFLHLLSTATDAEKEAILNLLRSIAAKNP